VPACLPSSVSQFRSGGHKAALLQPPHVFSECVQITKMLFSTTHFFRGFSSFRIEIYSGAVVHDLGRPCKGLRTGFLVKRNCLGRKHVRTRRACFRIRTTCSEKRILIGPEPRETMPYCSRSTRILTFLGESVSPLPSPSKGQASSSFPTKRGIGRL
jgi:hypothetical protein